MQGKGCVGQDLSCPQLCPIPPWPQLRFHPGAAGLGSGSSTETQECRELLWAGRGWCQQLELKFLFEEQYVAAGTRSGAAGSEDRAGLSLLTSCEREFSPERFAVCAFEEVREAILSGVWVSPGRSAAAGTALSPARPGTHRNCGALPRLWLSPGKLQWLELVLLEGFSNQIP